MFRGPTNISLDGKGRLAIPTRYREFLIEHCGGRLIATIDTREKCLLIYPQPRWEDIQQKVESLSSFDPATRRVQRLLIGHATDCQMDGTGRVLLAAPLREYAGLTKKTVLIGQGHRFELWDEDAWKFKREEWIENEEELEIPEALRNLSL